MDDKFFLVPSDLYKNLLKPNRGEISVENARTDLEKILNKKKINKSSKNILYNQELRRFLKLRKEAENKPVKVELSDGSLMVFNPYQAKQKGKIGAEFFKPYDDEGSEFTSIPELRGDETIKTADSEEGSQFSEHQQRRRRRKMKKHEDTNETKEAILNMLQQFPSEFGINEQHQILREDNRTPYKKSDIEHSVDRIVKRTVMNAPSPVGTKLLEKRLKENPRTKHLFSKSKEGEQSGSGYKKNKKMKKCNRKIVIKKWKWLKKNC